MIGAKEHHELICSLHTGDIDTIKKVLKKHAIYSKELCLKCGVIEEIAKNKEQNAFIEQKLTPIQYAVLRCSLEILQLLFQTTGTAGKDCIKAPSYDKKWTLLHFAAYAGNVEVYNYLMDNGANLEVSGKDGWRPLHLAIAKGRADLVKAMLAKGGDVSVCLPNGNNTIHVCVDRYQWTGKSDTDHSCRTEIIKSLIKRGVLVSQTNHEGETALQMCLFKQTGSADMVSALLAAPGAQAALNITMANGETLLHLATNKDIAEMLIKAGCKPNVARNDGRTVLHVVSNRDAAMVSSLISHGANPDAVDSQGRMPLHVALTREQVDLGAVGILLDAMSDVNAVDIGKNTILHIASAYLYKNIETTKYKDPLFELLIRAGVLINLQNKKGETALHLALKSGQYTKAGMLVKAGANVDILDISGASPRNMDTKWINRMLYQDPLDTRSRSSRSDRSGAISRSPGRSPARTPRNQLTAALADARLDKYLTPKPSPTPSAHSMRLSPANIEQFLSSSEGIDELTMRLGLNDEDTNDDGKNAESEAERKEREQLERQFTSLRREMTCLHDILESYTMTPSSPPSVTCTAPSVTSMRSSHRLHDKDAASDVGSDDLDMILEEKAILT